MNFDEDSDNYLPRRVGDRFITIDSDGKLTTNGDYPNQSSYVYISDFGNLTGISEELVPMGFGKLSQPNLIATASASYSGSHSDASMPSASYVGQISGNGQKNSRGTYDQNVYYGFDFASVDNQQYLAPLPTGTATGNNVTMSLENSFGNDDASTLGTKYSQEIIYCH